MSTIELNKYGTLVKLPDGWCQVPKEYDSRNACLKKLIKNKQAYQILIDFDNYGCHFKPILKWCIPIELLSQLKKPEYSLSQTLAKKKNKLEREVNRLTEQNNYIEHLIGKGWIEEKQAIRNTNDVTKKIVKYTQTIEDIKSFPHINKQIAELDKEIQKYSDDSMYVIGLIAQKEELQKKKDNILKSIQDIKFDE